jgi:hypothetical protein
MPLQQPSSLPVQPLQPMLLQPPLTVRSRYDSRFQLLPSCNHAHSVLLCVAHRCVQVPHFPPLPLRIDRRLMATLLVSSAAANSAK